jgi:hypothetical protein
VSGSGRRQWFFFWGRWYGDGKRRHCVPWSSNYVSLHVTPSNNPKFMYLCSVSYVVGVIRTLLMCRGRDVLGTDGFGNSTRPLLRIVGRWRSTSLSSLIRKQR